MTNINLQRGTVWGLENALFPRGFIYSFDADRAVKKPQNYAAIPVPVGALYFDETRLKILQGSHDDVTVMVLGRITCLTPTAPMNVCQELAQRFAESETQFHEFLDWLGGRYAIFVFHGRQVRVYHDLFATRSVYFDRTKAVVASHFRLLEESFSNYTSENDFSSHENLYRWWDFTPVKEIRSLMSNHYLYLTQADIAVVRYWPREDNQFMEQPDLDIYHEIIELWSRSIQRLLRTTPRIAVSLTGGQDSRVMLSLTRPAAGESLISFTYAPTEENLRQDQNFWSETYFKDLEIVGEIVSQTGIQHVLLRHRGNLPEHQEIEELLSSNKLGNLHGQWVIEAIRDEFEPDEFVHLRGNFIEAVRAATGTSPLESDLTNMLMSAEWVQERSFSEFKNMGQVDLEILAMEKFEEFGYLNLPVSYSKATLFHVEGRTASWHGEMLNEHDIMFDTYLPHNNRRLLELFWAIPVKDRSDGIAMRDLINRTFPILNFFSVNRSQNLYEQWREQLVSGVKRTSTIDDLLPAITDGKPTQTHRVSHVTLYESGVPKQTSTLANGGFHIPSASFPNMPTVVTNSISITQGNTADFVLRQTYSNPAGAGEITLGIAVNKQVIHTFDPALTATNTHVIVENLSLGDEISFVLETTQRRSSTSWRKASSSLISKVRVWQAERPNDIGLSVETESNEPRVRLTPLESQ